MRLIHNRTGLRVEARNERSQHANKEAAFGHLQAKLDRLLEEQDEARKRADYETKDECGFGATQIRTVRLVGRDQGVTDHRTGVVHGSPQAYLAGDLDRFLKAGR